MTNTDRPSTPQNAEREPALTLEQLEGKVTDNSITPAEVIQLTSRPATSPPVVPVPSNPNPYPSKYQPYVDIAIEWAFRLGFSSIFLVNALYAFLDPTSFTVMLENNVIASAIGHSDLMVKIALVNDLLLGIYILLIGRNKIVYLWAGGWLLIVAGLKLMNLVF